MRFLSFLFVTYLIASTPLALANDPEQSYHREIEKALAAIDRQSEDGSEISIPALNSTGSAMHDKAAYIFLQYTVDLRREMKRSNWAQMLFEDNTEEGYNFLSKPLLIKSKNSKLEKINTERLRHLAVFEKTVFVFKEGINELRAQYGKQADSFSSPYVDEMAEKYPVTSNEVFETFRALIQYANLNAGKVKPTADGLVSMPTDAETVKILTLIRDFELSLANFEKLADVQFN